MGCFRKQNKIGLVPVLECSIIIIILTIINNNMEYCMIKKKRKILKAIKEDQNLWKNIKNASWLRM